MAARLWLPDDWRKTKAWQPGWDYILEKLAENKNISEYENENYVFFKWITLNFLIFYEEDEIFTHINEVFTTPIKILTEITKEITQRTNLEIIEFLELFKYYSPMRYTLRVYFEQKIEKELELKAQPKDLKRNLLSSPHSSKTPKKFSKILAKFARSSDSLEFFNRINNIIKQSIEQYDFSQCQKELEIYEIYCSTGPILIVDSNLGNTPVAVNMKDLIARKVF